MPATGQPPPAVDALRLLYVDAQLLAFDKPAGMLSVPGRGPDLQDSLATRALVRWPDARVVHRLDMATSGVIILARGLDMQRRLNAAFEQRQVDKDYVAVVEGWLTGEAGEIELPLLPDWPNRPRQKVDTIAGKPALTRWRVLARGRGPGSARWTRLQLSPVTGRTHQLRVHLQAIGHPILGDALYASGHTLTAAPRLLLHAWRLALTHPASACPLRFEAPLPFEWSPAPASPLCANRGHKKAP